MARPIQSSRMLGPLDSQAALFLYLVGITLDFIVRCFIETGIVDHPVSARYFLIDWQASLLWPFDLLCRAVTGHF